MNYSTINQNYGNAQRKREIDRIQREVIAAKQIQKQTGCSWTEALKTAYASLYEPLPATVTPQVAAELAAMCLRGVPSMGKIQGGRA